MKRGIAKFCCVVSTCMLLLYPMELSRPAPSDAFCNIICQLKKFGYWRTDKIFDVLHLLLEDYVVNKFLPEIIYKALSTGDVLSLIGRLPWEDIPGITSRETEEIADETRRGASEMEAGSFAIARSSRETPVENIPKAVRKDMEQHILATSPDLKSFGTSFLPGASLHSLSYIVMSEGAGGRGGASAGYPQIQENIRHLADKMMREDVMEKISNLLTEVELLKETLEDIAKIAPPTAADGQTAGYDENMEETWHAIASNYGMLNDLAFKRELLLEKLNVLFMLETQVNGHIAAMESSIYAQSIKAEMSSVIERLQRGTFRRRGF